MKENLIHKSDNSLKKEVSAIFEGQLQFAINCSKEGRQLADPEFDKCVTLANTIGSKKLLAKAHRAYSIHFEGMGLYTVAHEHKKIYRRLYANIYYEHESRVKLISTYLKYLHENAEKEALRQRNVYLDRELGQLAAHLVSQTELVAKFRDELREITSKYPSDHPGIREVKEKLKELPCKQIDWEKFEAEFAAVHPEFTKKLYERYASLTPMEVKMCSLLRLNLKSHEIARLFCVTERAVEFHRLNIRKKCGIPKEQSLSVFLNNL